MDKLTKNILPEVVPGNLTKGERTKIQIIESAIVICGQSGIEALTYQNIGDHAGVTKQLVQKYFPEMNELFKIMVKYIRGTFQNDVITVFSRARTPSRMLESYCKAVFRWPADREDHVTTWCLFLYYTRVRPDLRNLNTKYVKMGTDRIEQIIKAGLATEEFSVSDVKRTAKVIQNVITGGLMCLMTENQPRTKIETLTVKTCMELVGVR